MVSAVGATVGTTVGTTDGTAEGTTVGIEDGTDEGAGDGRETGADVDVHTKDTHLKPDTELQSVSVVQPLPTVPALHTFEVEPPAAVPEQNAMAD